MPETTFTDPDLTTFLGLDALGLTAVGQHLTAERALIECRSRSGSRIPSARPAAPRDRLVGWWSGAWPTGRWDEGLPGYCCA